MSDQAQRESAEGQVVVKNSTMDAIVAVLLFIFGAVVIYEARRLGAGWTDDGPGSGYFPFYIGLIVCLAASGVFYQSVFGKSRDTAAFVDRQQLARVASVIVPAAIYVLGIVFLGVYIASAIYIALFMITLGKYSPVKAVLLGVAVNAFFFLMFEVWFKVPLFKGSWGLLDFLGY